MKMKKSVLLSLTMLFILSIVLAGCGSNNAATNSAKPGATVAATAAPTPETGVKIAGDFEIQYFVGGYGDAWWKSQLKQFNEMYPDLKIKESAGPKINEQMKPRWI